MNPFALASAKLTPWGVPLIPIPVGQKGPKLFGWQNRATVDPVQLTSWSDPKYNFNAGCVAKPDGICILDFDDMALLEKIDADIPPTLRVKSRKGLHVYFKQTDKTRALGNRSLPGKFDFQQCDKQCVSPFSIHPSGHVYAIVEDNPPGPCPDSVAKWIGEETMAQAMPTYTPDGLWVGGSSISKESFETWLELHDEAFGDGEYEVKKMRWGWLRDDGCPWASEHTNKDGNLDFKIYLHDLKGPQINCFHTSCGVGTNRHWRDYRQYLVNRSGHDYSMRTGQVIQPVKVLLFGKELSLSCQK